MHSSDVATPIMSEARSHTYWRRRIIHNARAYAFLLPALFLFAMFMWWPVVESFTLAFQAVTLRFERSWVGLANFRFIFGDKLFFIAWRNTLRYTAMAILFGYIVPVVLALAANEMRPWARDLFRLAYYLPVILPAVVTSLLWKWIFYPAEGGLLNAVLGFFGMPPLRWLNDQRLALPSIWITTTWGGAGGAMIMYMAGLADIPASLYEAAEIDGANIWQRIWYITLPQLRFLMLMMLISQFINNIQLFTQPWVLTQGGPNNATLTNTIYVYRQAFFNAQYGTASAAGLVIFAFLSIFSISYVVLITRRVK